MRKGQKLSPMPDEHTISQFNNNIFPSLIGIDVKAALLLVESNLVIHSVLDISRCKCLPTTKDVTVPYNDDITYCDVLTRIALTSSFIEILRNL